MSSTSQLTSFSDLYTWLLNRVRADTSQTATTTQAKQAINMGLQDMHLGTDYKFPWAERSGRLILRAQYSTGTVTATLGSATLSGTSTLWTTADAFGTANARTNGKIVVAGGPTPYTVSAVGGAGTITLSSAFTETTETDASYIYFEDEYALAADFLRPVDLQSFSDELNIGIIGRTEFRRRFPTNSAPASVPSVACIVDAAPSGNTTPVRRVRFAPPPSTAKTVPYSYITSYLAVSSSGTLATALSGDTDEPIVPLRYRHAIAYWALYGWYRDKKDDSRSQEAKGEYTDIMLRVMADTDIGASRPQLQPRSGMYARSAKRPYSGAGARRYDINGRFDRLEDR